MRFVLRTQHDETLFERDSRQEAVSYSKDLLRGGEYSEQEETYWLRGSLSECFIDEDGDECETCFDTVVVGIDPEEPDCDPVDEEHAARKSDEDSEKGHRWRTPHRLVGGIEENPGVWGHGGGVICLHACTRCGCQRKVDTWAQDRETGEQGLESVSYSTGVYTEQLLTPRD